MLISDAEWKKIETALGSAVSGTGTGGYLRDYESAHKKLTALGATDAKNVSAEAAKSGLKQATAAWTALMKAQGTMMKVVKAKKLNVNTPAYKNFMAFMNMVAKGQDEMMALERALKAKV